MRCREKTRFRFSRVNAGGRSVQRRVVPRGLRRRPGPANGGTYHLNAAAHGDPNKSGTAEVTVPASLPPQQDQVVTVSPQSLLIQIGGAAVFVASAPRSGLADFTVLEGADGGSFNG